MRGCAVVTCSVAQTPIEVGQPIDLNLINLMDKLYFPEANEDNSFKIHACVKGETTRIPHRCLAEINCGFVLQTKSDLLPYVKINHFFHSQGLIYLSVISDNNSFRVLVCNVGRNIIEVKNENYLGDLYFISTSKVRINS